MLGGSERGSRPLQALGAQGTVRARAGSELGKASVCDSGHWSCQASI